MGMHGHEKALWEDVLAQLNPDWSISLQEVGGATGARLSELDVAIYLYDTSTGSRAGCQCKSEDMRSAARATLARSDANKSLLTALHDLDRQKALATQVATDQLVKDTMSLSMLYLTTTQTYRHVTSAYGTVAGHWMLLLYRFEDRPPALRPAYLMHETKLLSAQELQAWVTEMVEHDMTAQGSSINTLLKDAGWPKLASHLQ